MDPITTAIVTAISTGLAKDIIKDSYEALKALLKRKFSAESDLIDAIEKLEKKPDSEARKATLQEELAIAKVNDDLEVVKLAQALLTQLNEQVGDQAGIHQTQTNSITGVTVGGNFEFKPVQANQRR
ncbi:hypothetical protein ACN4EK_07320 [Pantanalinema rosaneae CENA516]|uniref:hypothetical protein n=1 Tax=Pantanalinema rosaneae TaxID=1620701 RepID=UPI003D6EEFA7